nr:chromate transporter [Maliibacterium massiliense]
MQKKIRLPKWLEMFLVMMKIGAFTFGGGWSIIAQMQRDFVEKRGWLSEQDLVDQASIGRSLPGIMIVNTVAIFGYHMGGVAYGILAAVALTMPAFLVMTVVTICYSAVRDNVWIAKAMVGVRASVVPIILSACITLKKSSIQDWMGWAIAAVALCLFLFTNINNILIIVLGAVAGLLIRGGKEKRHDLS